jgi:hypothetical protein
MRAFWCFAGLACVLAVPRAAHATEKQQNFGLQLGGTLMSTQGGGSPFGPNVALHYSYGITDAWNIVVEGDFSAFPQGAPPKTPPPQPGFVTTGGVGAMYIFDVMRLVPYAGALAGAAYFGGGYLAEPTILPDLQLCAGVDYPLTPSWTVGAAYRQHMFVFNTGTYPEFTTLGLRLDFTWGR